MSPNRRTPDWILLDHVGDVRPLGNIAETLNPGIGLLVDLYFWLKKKLRHLTKRKK